MLTWFSLQLKVMSSTPCGMMANFIFCYLIVYNMKGLHLQITVYGSEVGKQGEPRPFQIFGEIKKRTPISNYASDAWPY